MSMHPAQKAFGCLVYSVLAVFVTIYLVHVYVGENRIRKFLYDHFSKEIRVDWDSIPMNKKEREKYRR